MSCCNIKISFVSQCRIIVAVQYICSCSLMTTQWARNATYDISRNAQSEQHQHYDADIEDLMCCKLKIINYNAHLVRICPKDGRQRYNYVITICTIIPESGRLRCCQQGLKHNLECSSCATDDELHTQFFAFCKMWNRLKYHFFSYQSTTSMLCKSSLEASLLSCTWGYRFDVLAAPCGVHVAHGHSCQSIHSAEIIP